MEISRAQIYHIFKSDHISTEVLGKAADALDVPITDFFESDDSHNRVAVGGISTTTASTGSVAVSATGTHVEQKNLGHTRLSGKGAAEAAQLLERLTKCEQERDSWERERTSYQETIRTQREMIELLKPAARL